MNSEAGDVPAKEQNGRAYLLLSLTALCWAANTIFGQLAVGEVSPMALVVLRWLGVLILLLVFARGHIRRHWPVLRRHLVFVSAMGMLGFAGFNGLFYTAAHSTTAVNMGILQGVYPDVRDDRRDCRVADPGHRHARRRRPGNHGGRCIGCDWR